MPKWSNVVNALEDARLLSGLPLEIARSSKVAKTVDNVIHLSTGEGVGKFLTRDRFGKNRHIDTINNALSNHFSRNLCVKFDIIPGFVNNCVKDEYDAELVFAKSILGEHFPNVTVVKIERIKHAG